MSKNFGLKLLLTLSKPRGENTTDKLKVLTAHLSAPIYKVISEETTYESAITALQNLFVKPKNEIKERTAHACNSQTRH